MVSCHNTLVVNTIQIPANMLKNSFSPGYVELKETVLVHIYQKESFLIITGRLLLHQTKQQGGHLLGSGKQHQCLPGNVIAIKTH